MHKRIKTSRAALEQRHADGVESPKKHVKSSTSPASKASNGQPSRQAHQEQESKEPFHSSEQLQSELEECQRQLEAVIAERDSYAKKAQTGTCTSHTFASFGVTSATCTMEEVLTAVMASYNAQSAKMDTRRDSKPA